MRRSDDGTAVVEIAILGTLVFGVLVHTLVVLGALHRATLATSAAAREYGRAVVLADGAVAADARGAAVVAEVARNHALPADALRSEVTGGRVRGGVLVVTVRTDVPVAAFPFLGDVVPGLSVPVEATHAVRLDRYRSGA